MPERKKSSKAKQSSEDKVVQARITTKTAEQMRALLEGRPFEVVARGPHQLPDGTCFAELVGPRDELEKLPKGDWSVEIREPRVVKDADKQVGEGNRYAKKGAVPRGLGVKK